MGDEFGDSSLISTSVLVIHSRRPPEKSRPQHDREGVVHWDFATTGPRTPKNAVNYQWHRSLRQNSGGDQQGVSLFLVIAVVVDRSVGERLQSLDQGRP